MTDPDVIVKQLVAEATRAYDGKALLATVIFAYVVIDSMAYASLPAGRTQVQAADFKAWVDRYMVAVDPAEYHYSGEEIYAARCELLHTIRVANRANVKRIAYHNGYPHRYRADIEKSFVMLSIPQLLDDLWAGVARFLQDARRTGTSDMVTQRLEEMLRIVPYNDGATS